MGSTVVKAVSLPWDLALLQQLRNPFLPQDRRGSAVKHPGVLRVPD